LITVKIAVVDPMPSANATTDNAATLLALLQARHDLESANIDCRVYGITSDSPFSPGVCTGRRRAFVACSKL